MENKTAVITEASASVKALWLHPEGTAEPYMHIIDGKCDCKTCESKIRHIIFPCAA
jgi:hypothetical protein